MLFLFIFLVHPHWGISETNLKGILSALWGFSYCSKSSKQMKFSLKQLRASISESLIRQKLLVHFHMDANRILYLSVCKFNLATI